jgi:hypothetical protein
MIFLDRQQGARHLMRGGKGPEIEAYLSSPQGIRTTANDADWALMMDRNQGSRLRPRATWLRIPVTLPLIAAA